MEPAKSWTINRIEPLNRWSIERIRLYWPSVRLPVPAVHADHGGARRVKVTEEGGVVRQDVGHLRVLTGEEKKSSNEDRLRT